MARPATLVPRSRIPGQTPGPAWVRLRKQGGLEPAAGGLDSVTIAGVRYTIVNEALLSSTTLSEPPVPDERFAVHPMQRRFLFVDIAAQRAKQLRRGALNRLQPPAADPRATAPAAPHKAERIAMEEVRRGFIQYDMPAASPSPAPTDGDA